MAPLSPALSFFKVTSICVHHHVHHNRTHNSTHYKHTCTKQLTWEKTTLWLMLLFKIQSSAPCAWFVLESYISKQNIWSSFYILHNNRINHSVPYFWVVIVKLAISYGKNLGGRKRIDIYLSPTMWQDIYLSPTMCQEMCIISLASCSSQEWSKQHLLGR